MKIKTTNQQGIAIVEALIAIMLMTITLTISTQLLLRQATSVEAGKAKANADKVADSTLNKLMSMRAADLPSTGSVISYDSDGNAVTHNNCGSQGTCVYAIYNNSTKEMFLEDRYRERTPGDGEVRKYLSVWEVNSSTSDSTIPLRRFKVFVFMVDPQTEGAIDYAIASRETEGLSKN